MLVAALQLKKAMPESGIQVTCHSSLIPVMIRKQILRCYKNRGKKELQSSFFPRFFTVRTTSITHMKGMSGFP